jgi:hypothetical protein
MIDIFQILTNDQPSLYRMILENENVLHICHASSQQGKTKHDKNVLT